MNIASQRPLRGLMLGALCAGAYSAMMADITLPQFFTDNMIVQRNATLTIPGKATPGSTVTVTADWDGAKASAKADGEGRFRLQLSTPEAGGPFTIIISDGKDRKVLSNVLSGEVWLASGQSNMEFPAKGWGHLVNEDAVVNSSHHPDIRMLQVKKNRSTTPLEDAEVNMGGWVFANPATMDISAIAYLYALQLHDELKIPIGVIDSSWGGTMAESWMPYDVLTQMPGVENEVAALAATDFSGDGLLEEYSGLINSWHDRALASVKMIDTSKRQKGWNTVAVPSFWSVGDLVDVDGMVWTQTSIDLPASAAGRPLQLHLGCVDDQDDTWFNGTLVGHIDGSSAQRNYTVPGELVRKGENVVTVLITDTGGPGGLWSEADAIYAEDADGNRYPLAGEWSYSVAGTVEDLPLRPYNPTTPNYPTLLYNAMIHPLEVMPVRGVIWYQGCSNVERPRQYAQLFPTLVKSWRDAWGNEEMPFYFVQIAGYLGYRPVQPASQWAYLRDAQTAALKLPNTGMAVAADLGNPADIHPANKQEVARRLSLWALNRDYGKDVPCEGPSCTGMSVKGDKAVLTFSEPLHPTSSVVTGFILRDADGTWAYAKAEQTAPDTLMLSSPLVKKPAEVRYNWADYPDGNLYGATSLPVAQFSIAK